MGKEAEPRGREKCMQLKSTETNVHAKITGEYDVSFKNWVLESVV